MASAADGPATFSFTQTIPVPPASTYAGSGGGDGWAVALSDDAVFNVFHHAPQMQVACHLQSNAAPCWNPRVVRDLEGHDFRVSGQPGLFLDADDDRLYVYGTRDADSSAGVVCIDTVAAATATNPFCGYTALAAAGQATTASGVSNSALIAGKLYAFNYAHGVGSTGAQNRMLCFDTTTLAACAGQPFAVAIGDQPVSSGGSSFRVPSTTGIGTRIYVPIHAGTEKLACFDGITQAACAGAWPIVAPAGTVESGSPFPTLNPAGDVTGVCVPVDGLPCFDLAGASKATPAGMASALTPGTPWNGPAFRLGPRIYRANGEGDKVECFNFNTSATCEGFPKQLTGAGYMYTVNPDPRRPTCIWINADFGASQIQNFDAYTGKGCGEGPIRVLTSSIVVPDSTCVPNSYKTLQVLTPARATYDEGRVQFLDGDGSPIAGVDERPLDATGTVSLEGLNLTSPTGLPQFAITLLEPTGPTSSVDVKLTWTGANAQECVKPGTTKTVEPVKQPAPGPGGPPAGPAPDPIVSPPPFLAVGKPSVWGAVRSGYNTATPCKEAPSDVKGGWKTLGKALLCVGSGKVFFDDGLKGKARCIVSIGADIVPVGKLDAVRKAAGLFAKEAKGLTKDLKALKPTAAERELIDQVDAAGDAWAAIASGKVLAVGGQKVIQALLTSRQATLGLQRTFRIGNRSNALQRLKKTQALASDLFTVLSGIQDAAECRKAFK